MCCHVGCVGVTGRAALEEAKSKLTSANEEEKGIAQIGVEVYGPCLPPIPLPILFFFLCDLFGRLLIPLLLPSALFLGVPCFPWVGMLW